MAETDPEVNESARLGKIWMSVLEAFYARQKLDVIERARAEAEVELHRRLSGMLGVKTGEVFIVSDGSGLGGRLDSSDRIIPGTANERFYATGFVDFRFIEGQIFCVWESFVESEDSPEDTFITSSGFKIEPTETQEEIQAKYNFFID